MGLAPAGSYGKRRWRAVSSRRPPAVTPPPDVTTVRWAAIVRLRPYIRGGKMHAASVAAVIHTPSPQSSAMLHGGEEKCGAERQR